MFIFIAKFHKDWMIQQSVERYEADFSFCRNQITILRQAVEDIWSAKAIVFS